MELGKYIGREFNDATRNEIIAEMGAELRAHPDAEAVEVEVKSAWGLMSRREKVCWFILWRVCPFMGKWAYNRDSKSRRFLLPQPKGVAECTAKVKSLAPVDRIKTKIEISRHE